MLKLNFTINYNVYNIWEYIGDVKIFKVAYHVYFQLIY